MCLPQQMWFHLRFQLSCSDDQAPILPLRILCPFDTISCDNEQPSSSSCSMAHCHFLAREIKSSVFAFSFRLNTHIIAHLPLCYKYLWLSKAILSPKSLSFYHVDVYSILFKKSVKYFFPSFCSFGVDLVSRFRDIFMVIVNAARIL